MNKLHHSEIFRYILTGGMTTGVNYVIYFGLSLCQIDYLFANSIAWMGAVIFAFYGNRHVVFHSQGDKVQEFISFFGLRFVTLLIENGLLYLLVELAGVGTMGSKILVSVITVVLNYAACKYGIFRKRSVSHE